MESFSNRKVTFGEIILIKHEDYTNTTIDKSLFSGLYYQNNGYYKTYVNPDKTHYNFKCNNSKNECGCQGSCYITIKRNEDGTITPLIKLGLEHNSKCKDNPSTLQSKESNFIILEKAKFICKNFSYLTKEEVKIFFGMSDKMVNDIFNKIKGIKKN